MRRAFHHRTILGCLVIAGLLAAGGSWYYFARYGDAQAATPATKTASAFWRA